VREHPDHHDAELLLRLYDLRREAKLRDAREWFIREFRAKTLEDYRKQCPMGSEEHTFFRMVLGYWDMAASVVSHGLINEEFFFENTTEFWAVWDKVKELAAALRETLKNPLLWKSLETLAGKFEEWTAKRAPQALEALRKRLQETAAGKKA
jgi:hypothetical protein